MRARSIVLPIAAIALLQVRARAENFVELAGGVMMPVEDDTWTNYVDAGPKLAARVGGIGESHLGGVLSVDWSPLNLNDQGFGNLADITGQRFRILASVMTLQKIGPKLYASLRIGGGIDITYTHVQTKLGPLSSDETDTDSGLAIEAAGGLWLRAGGIQLGGELALPLSFNSDGKGENIDLKDYTSFDIDILFGVRFFPK
jgi:hypothetical protein